MIKFLFFAQLVEHAECDSLELEYQAGQLVQDYLDSLAMRLPNGAIEMISDSANMVSINQTLASWSDPVADGDEIALLPPFSGG